MKFPFGQRKTAGFAENVQLNDNLVIKVLIGLALISLLVAMFPSNESIEYSYQVGTVWTNSDLIAAFSFPIYKDTQLYEKEKREVATTVVPVVQRRDEIVKAQLDSLASTFNFLIAAVVSRTKWMETSSAGDSTAFVQSVSRLPFSLSESQWILVSRAQGGKANFGSAFSKFQKLLRSVAADVYRIGIVDSETERQPGKDIALRKGTVEEVGSRDKFFTLSESHTEVQQRLRSTSAGADFGSLGSDILKPFLTANLIYDRAETDRLIKVAEDAVPRTVGFVQENERIVSKHDRITDDVRLKLDSYRRAKASRGSDSDIWTQRIGVLFHVTLIVGLYGVYLFLFRKRVFHNNAMLTLIGLLLLMETFFAYLTLSLSVPQPIQYLIFVPAASMLLTIIFDSRVAFYGTVTMAFLLAAIRGNDYAIALSSLVAGALGAYTVRDLRNRTQIFRSLGFIFLGYSVSILALAFERFESLNTIATELTFALANSVFSPVLTYGLLIFFERVFHVATDLTLLELSDFNNPLLRQLSEKAPGTFHHSLTIGNMAEAAAEAVGANSILARVGGYYHDIGKVEKPEYFVENQTGTHSKHSKLRPRMSALVIISHVKEGIELARRNGLPEKVVDFIPQHHGTNRISYFYDKALKQAAARKNPKDTIREEDFCYPGPKPQSKEAAIVMLADLVEAATRTIKAMTPQKLEQAIDNMVKQRFVEGQLDECELTLKDLTKIKEAFFKILVGIHHHRIQYPDQIVESVAGQDQQQPSKSEPQAPVIPETTQAQEVPAAAPPAEPLVQPVEPVVTSEQNLVQEPTTPSP